MLRWVSILMFLLTRSKLCLIPLGHLIFFRTTTYRQKTIICYLFFIWYTISIITFMEVVMTDRNDSLSVPAQTHNSEQGFMLANQNPDLKSFFTSCLVSVIVISLAFIFLIKSLADGDVVVRSSVFGGTSINYFTSMVPALASIILSFGATAASVVSIGMARKIKIGPNDFIYTYVGYIILMISLGLLISGIVSWDVSRVF